MTDTSPRFTRDRMRSDIAHALRVRPEELSGADDLADWGLDSMRAMGLLLAWNDDGVRLEFADLAEQLTLDAWWAQAERVMALPKADPVDDLHDA